jgi:hypothetical protein
VQDELVVRAMHTRVNRIPPALKHGAYSATSVLPGESRAAFEKLHRGLIDELNPSGVLEDDIVADMARLVWRKQNLGTLRIAELAQDRWSETEEIGTEIEKENDEKEIYLRAGVSEDDYEKGKEKYNEETRVAEEEIRVEQDRVRKELGDTFELVEIDDAATFDGLTKELDVKERLDAAIARCLKQLLLVRGVKSVAATPAAASPKRALAPPKAA